MTTFSPRTLRLDLKCGKGSISKGEKCHKGTATAVVAAGVGLTAGALALRALSRRSPRGRIPVTEGSRQRPEPLRRPQAPQAAAPPPPKKPAKREEPRPPQQNREATKAPKISIPESASRAITARTEPTRIRTAAESLISWQTPPGAKDAMSLKEAEALVRKKGRILDIYSIPGIDAEKATDDIVRSRESEHVIKVRNALRQFYRDAADPTPEVNLDGPSTEYYRTHPEARRKKVAKQAEINRRPDERRRRAALSRERRKRGIDGKGGPDVSHTTSGGTVLEDPSTNRGRNGHGRRPRLKRDSIWAEGFQLQSPSSNLEGITP